MAWFPSMQRQFQCPLSSLALLVSAIQLAGCVMMADQRNMVPSDVPISPRNQSAVSLQVASDELQQPVLPAKEFREALEKAILISGVFGRVDSNVPAKYSLQVQLNSLDVQAALVWDVHLRLVTTWELRRTDTGAIQWKDIIATKHTTLKAEAGMALARVKLATEAAARSNIREALQQIRLLNLD